MLSWLVYGFLLGGKLSRIQTTTAHFRQHRVRKESVVSRRSSSSLFQRSTRDYHDNEVFISQGKLICQLGRICWFSEIDVDTNQENSKECVELHKVRTKMICERHVRNLHRCRSRIDEGSIDPKPHPLATLHCHTGPMSNQPVPSRSGCWFSSSEIMPEKSSWLPLPVLIYTYPNVPSNSFFLFSRFSLLTMDESRPKFACSLLHIDHEHTQQNITCLLQFFFLDESNSRRVFD